MSEEENQENSSEESSEESPDLHSKEPGFSFSKSAIADLPSTAVQSIHIENDSPVEVDDDVFVWRDTSPSGTKLNVKSKFKRQDFKESPSKQTKANAKPAAKTATTVGGKAHEIAAKVHSKIPDRKVPKLATKEKVTSKEKVKQSSQTKVAAQDSKNQVHTRRAPSQEKGASLTKVTGDNNRAKANTGSKTKMVQSRPKEHK